MNDQQLEAVLRSSLARHADTVDSGPTWPLADDELATHRPRKPVTWWPVAAAVVAVLAVIGVVLAVRHATSDHSRPATPDTVTRTACPTSMPKPWQDAVRDGYLPDRANGALLGIGPDGAVVIGKDEQILLVRPDGSSQPILNASWTDVMPAGGIPDADIFSGQTVAIDDRWIVVPVMTGPPDPNNDFHVKLVLIDHSNPHNKRDIPIATKPDKLSVFGDHVYTLYGGKGTGSVQDYDIVTAKTRTLTRQASYLAATPHGVAWTDAHEASHLIAGQDPTLVPGQAGSQPQARSDGDDHAWWTSDGIGWYSQVTRQTVVVRGLDPDDKGHAVAAVVGAYVVVYLQDPGDVRVVDTRTGAVARLAQVGSVNAGGGGIAYTGDHGTVRLDTRGLPGLYC